MRKGARRIGSNVKSSFQKGVGSRRCDGVCGKHVLDAVVFRFSLWRQDVPN